MRARRSETALRALLPRTLLLAAAALACFARGAAAMYEDQAGTFDWHRQHVGEVVAAGYAPGRDRFYVATSQSVVAALSAADGSIAWRRTYTDDDPLGAALPAARPAALVAASGGGRYVRAWDANGGLKWEGLAAPVAAAAGGSTALAAVTLQDGPGVALVGGGLVQVRPRPLC
jgi:outer membrane protein assembly factor BamB